jgi:hypothetical protein
LSRVVGIPDQLRDAIRQSLFGPATADRENARASAQATAPVVWLLGKTGAGKTAIIAALTGDARAEIGLGFEPCTRTAAFYDVPPEAPLLRFLDTRGVGEAGYDPAGDMSWCEGHSHLVLVVMQVSDPAQHAHYCSRLRDCRRRARNVHLPSVGSRPFRFERGRFFNSASVFLESKLQAPPSLSHRAIAAICWLASV